jgi:hypothetical protein
MKFFFAWQHLIHGKVLHFTFEAADHMIAKGQMKGRGIGLTPAQQFYSLAT